MSGFSEYREMPWGIEINLVGAGAPARFQFVAVVSWLLPLLPYKKRGGGFIEWLLSFQNCWLAIPLSSNVKGGRRAWHMGRTEARAIRNDLWHKRILLSAILVYESLTVLIGAQMFFDVSLFPPWLWSVDGFLTNSMQVLPGKRSFP